MKSTSNDDYGNLKNNAKRPSMPSLRRHFLLPSQNVRFQVVVAVVTIASVVIALLLYFTENSVLSEQITIVYVFDFAVVSLLVIDFYVRARDAKCGTAKYMLVNSFELPAMLPLLFLNMIEEQALVGASVRSLSLIRLLRLTRLFRLANLFRATRYLRKSGFVYFSVTIAACVIFGSIAVFAIEGEGANTTIHTYEDAVWFALTSVTISGYGDVYPVTSAGRIIGGILIFSGLALVLGFLSTLWGTLVSDRLKAQLRAAKDDRETFKKKIDEIEKMEKREMEQLLDEIRNLYNRTIPNKAEKGPDTQVHDR